MPTAPVLSAGPCLHPESGRDLMRVEVTHPYAQGGQTCPTTWIWAERAMPEPLPGETIEWDGGHVYYRNVKYHKPEYDDNPCVLWE